MHNDQKRIQECLLPLLEAKVASNKPEDVRDCTIFNRLYTQGPDPLFLMGTCPEEFTLLCTALELDEEVGRKAIEDAHVQGPGCLLEGRGLPQTFTHDLATYQQESLRKEALWLILASCAICTEEGYAKGDTLLSRIQVANRAVVSFSKAVVSLTPLKAMIRATEVLIYFNESTQFTYDEQGRPHGVEDHSFYIGYKKGHKAVAVQTSGPLFWGTTPDTSLAEQGIQVDKEISPQFGLVFAPQ